MPVTNRWTGAATLAALLFIGCSEGETTVDAGPVGEVDAGRVCTKPPETDCTSQTQCGTLRGTVSRACEGAGKCVYKAKLSPVDCLALQPLVNVQTDIDSVILSGTKPQSLFFRGYYSARKDGSPVTCAQLAALPPNSDGTSGKDTDPTANRAYWDGVGVNNPTTSIVTSLNLNEGTTLVLDVEAWSGRIDTLTGRPQGIRVGRGCVENIVVGAQQTPPQQAGLRISVP